MNSRPSVARPHRPLAASLGRASVRSRSLVAAVGCVVGCVVWAALTVPRAARADSLLPYGVVTFSDDAGPYYVIVRPTTAGRALHPAAGEDRGEFVVARRATSVAASPGPAVRRVEEAGPPDLVDAVPAGDALAWRGRLSQLPHSVAVASDGTWFVAFDSWAHEGREAALTVVRPGGETISLTLEELFPAAERARLARHRGGVLWRRGAWVVGSEAFVATFAGAVAAVHVERGSVREVTNDELVRRLPEVTPRVQALVLDGFERRDVSPPPAALRPLLAADRPGPVRVRAAARLAATGDPDAKRLLVDLARAPCTGEAPPADVAYAIERLPLAAPSPTAALAAFAALVADHGDAVAGPVTAGVVRLLDAAPREVAATIADPAARPQLRMACILAVRERPRSEFVEPLGRVIGARDPWLVPPAIATALAVAEAGLEPCTALLGLDVDLDAELLDRLAEVRCPGAVATLVGYLGDGGRSASLRRATVGALRFQTGADLGDDVDAWRRWLASRPPR